MLETKQDKALVDSVFKRILIEKYESKPEGMSNHQECRLVSRNTHNASVVRRITLWLSYQPLDLMTSDWRLSHSSSQISEGLNSVGGWGPFQVFGFMVVVRGVFSVAANGDPFRIFSHFQCTFVQFLLFPAVQLSS